METATKEGGTMATEVFSGEWLLNEGDNGYSRAYEGELFTTWSGGVSFLTTRNVLATIAAEQRLYANMAPDLDWEQITIDPKTGDATLHLGGGETFPIQRVGKNLYVVGFGWTWERVDRDEADTIYAMDTATVAEAG